MACFVAEPGHCPSSQVAVEVDARENKARIFLEIACGALLQLPLIIIRH